MKTSHDARFDSPLSLSGSVGEAAEVVTELRETLQAAESAVETREPPRTSSWWSVLDYTGFLSSGTWYQTQAYEALVQTLTGDVRLIDTCTRTDTKVACVAALVSVEPLQPYVFRNYVLPAQAACRHQGECDVFVWEAVRASTAAPGYFELFERDGNAFRDGGMVANNPAGIALHEGQALWPDKRLSVLLSVGTGTPPPRTVSHPAKYAQLLGQVASGCAETEKTHSILADTLGEAYTRMQPVDDLYAVGLDETAPEKLEQLRTTTHAWIADKDELFRKVVAQLRAKDT